jgi:Rod binding domain-containing protein
VSTLPISRLAGLTPVDQAKLPADVRKAGPKAEQLYSSALGFEQLMLQQLAQALNSTTNVDGSSSDDSGADDSASGSIGGDSTASTMLQMLPDAFAKSLTSAGGIGIARELYDSMKAGAGITSPEKAQSEKAR